MDQISLRELSLLLWKKKLTILSVTSLFAITSVIYALSLSNTYKAEAVLLPTEEAQGGGINSLSSQLGGLATLAGLNLNSSGTNMPAKAMEVLYSRKFITHMNEKYDLTVAIMAVQSWDIESNTFSYRESDYDPESKTWIRDVSAPFKPEPSNWEFYKQFISQLEITKDNSSGAYTLSFIHQSPFVAKEIVDNLILELNEELKATDIKETQKSIDYLQQQIEKSTLTSMEQVFYNLIEEQYKTIMLAETRDDYVFKVIDPAIVPEDRHSPKRALICILITFLGFIVSCLVALSIQLNGKSET